MADPYTCQHRFSERNGVLHCAQCDNPLRLVLSTYWLDAVRGFDAVDSLDDIDTVLTSGADPSDKLEAITEIMAEWTTHPEPEEVDE